MTYRVVKDEPCEPEPTDDPHTAGYAAALLDTLQLIDPDRSTR